MIVHKFVAPFTGAWIETPTGDHHSAASQSHPSRVRGLKRRKPRYGGIAIQVAPFTGAWIETFQRVLRSPCLWSSHPSRVRGLKRLILGIFPGLSPSHPSRVRGLKLPRP